MIYPEEIKTDENGRALICPVCQNEQTLLGDYCPICGNYILNKCNYKYDNGKLDSCDTTLKGNFRYCPTCGANSTFYDNGYLKEWGPF